MTPVRAISKPLDEGLKKIEDNMNQDFRKIRLSIEDLELAGQAYTLLALLCKDQACACVRSAEDGNGYQAWQALLRARTARNATNFLNHLLQPTLSSPDPKINIRQWNKNPEEYATRTGERVSDGIRRAVRMTKIAPQYMRQHLMLNQSRLRTAEEVAQEIEDSWDATEEFSRDDKKQAGFVAPVGKGSVKGGKPDGVPYNFGKGSGTQGKGKMHKGLGFQPELGEQRQFGGYCNWCWRIGHKEAQCWFKPEYIKSNPSQDPLQRDIREWSNMSEKGQGHSQPKGKGKGKGNFKRKHPGKGNHNQDQGGSPNEDGQRTLGDFGFKSQRVEFVGDVQGNDDFENTRLDQAPYVFCVQKCNSVTMDSTELPSLSKRVSDGNEKPLGTHENFDQSTGEVLFAVGCRDDQPMSTLEVLCPRVQWIMRRRFRQRKYNTV